jgi:hypothetical protein
MHDNVLKFIGQNRALEEQNEELRIQLASKDETNLHLKTRLKRVEEICNDSQRIHLNLKNLVANLEKKLKTSE